MLDGYISTKDSLERSDLEREKGETTWETTYGEVDLWFLGLRVVSSKDCRRCKRKESRDRYSSHDVRSAVDGFTTRIVVEMEERKEVGAAGELKRVTTGSNGSRLESAT